MASKKKASKKKAPKKETVKRKCGDCGKRGHNKRSHEPGGRLA